MGRIDNLLAEFRTQLALPRSSSSAKVWMLVYDHADERRLRARLDAFADAITKAKLSQHPVDMTALVAEWMGSHAYADAYFAEPDLASAEASTVAELAATRLGEALDAAKARGPDSVVTVIGTAGLFGNASVSDLVRHIEAEIPGRLVVFFPGTVRNSRLRLLDGRDGWDYRALVLTGES